jgi:hypothetical protein
MAKPYELMADGIELQAFNGIGERFPSFLHCTLNHGPPGHFALVLPLLRHRIFAKHGRIVTLSSEGHRATEPNFSLI